MTINGFLDITLAVPDPEPLAEFWKRRGLRRAGRSLGTPERPRQLTIVEGAYRHLAALHLGCSSEADLAATAARLDALGIATQARGTTLECNDPVFDHRVVIDVVGPAPLTAGPGRVANRPGHRGASHRRAPMWSGKTSPRPPRRVGHVVLGTPHVADACAFYLDGLGLPRLRPHPRRRPHLRPGRSRPPQPADPARAA